MLGMLLEFSVMDLVYSALGIAIVFAVLAILIGYLAVQRKVLGCFDRKKPESAPEITEEALPAIEEGISEEEIAAISAALAAYYDGCEDENTDFVVRRIRKI